MSGLNFLLWTIAVVLILGAVVFVAACVIGYFIRKRVANEFGIRYSFKESLGKAQAEQEELFIKQHSKK